MDDLKIFSFVPKISIKNVYSLEYIYIMCVCM